MIKIALPNAYTNISSTVVISYIHIVLYDCLNDFKLHNDVNKCQWSTKCNCKISIHTEQFLDENDEKY